MWHRPAATHREWPCNDFNGLAALAYRTRPSHLASATADIWAVQLHIGGRPDSALSASIDARRKPSHRQVQLKYLKFK